MDKLKGAIPTGSQLAKLSEDEKTFEEKKELASLCGKYLRSWQDEKKKYEIDSKELEKDIDKFL